MLLIIFWCSPQKYPFHKARELGFVMFFRWLFHEEGYSLQVGSCLTPATPTCQRASPSGLPERSALRFSRSKRFPEKMDASRLDAAVALRMRLAGYTRAEVANEMYRKARPLRKEESRDWKEYARRTVWYAFGTSGDIDIASFQPTPEKILTFHQEAERIEAEREGTPEPQRPLFHMR
jgi:hypothetical protein